MNKEKWNKVSDKHKLVGAVIENITQSEDNGRKGMLIRTISGKLYHVESEDEKSNLLIYKKIVYTSNTDSKNECNNCKDESDGVTDCVIDGDCPDKKEGENGDKKHK